MHYRPPWLKTGEVLFVAGDTGEIAFMWFGHATAPYSALRPDSPATVHPLCFLLQQRR
jgi:hypothetical protein